MEIYESRQFMIFSSAELGSINFEEVCETSAETVRKSVDESKTFVKWDGEATPASVDALTTKEGPFTYSEMLDILSGAEWTPAEIA